MLAGLNRIFLSNGLNFGLGIDHKERKNFKNKELHDSVTTLRTLKLIGEWGKTIRIFVTSSDM